MSQQDGSQRVDRTLGNVFVCVCMCVCVWGGGGQGRVNCGVVLVGLIAG